MVTLFQNSEDSIQLAPEKAIFPFTVSFGHVLRKRLKTDPLRFFLETWCSQGMTFTFNLCSPSIPGKLHVEKWAAEHASRKDYHVVPHWVVWMHIPGGYLPTRSGKREMRGCVNSLSHTLLLSSPGLAKLSAQNNCSYSSSKLWNSHHLELKVFEINLHSVTDGQSR